MNYKVHTIETAPEAAREALEGAKKSVGFVPNLLGVMAEAPSLLKAYRTIAGLFEQTSFSATERQTILLTISYENDCNYCVAAHSVIAGMQNVPGDVVNAIRAGQPIHDERLEALRVFTVAMLKSRGWPSAEEKVVFFAAGYGELQILEIVLAIGFKTLSNYTNHITNTPLDEAFAKAAWSKAA